ncbi:hypothetical protein Q8A67_025337 [Cirrhinus molitorella]|uniref:Uncharacterized protein n=1 Tax=Cirrhinus molitorella TaxID=172907 RepID=A0AA88NXH7_9TELE|nr:hypothetical protein Q8A67_025337 [Cirrhinus molitorella]
MLTQLSEMLFKKCSYILVLSSRGGERTSTVSPFSQCGMFSSHQAQANKQSSVPAVVCAHGRRPALKPM